MLSQSFKLILLQLMNLAVPLLTILYVEKNLSNVFFGNIVVVFTLIAYLQIGLEYSFSITLPRYIDKYGILNLSKYIFIFRFIIFILFVFVFFLFDTFFEHKLSFVFLLLLPYAVSIVLQPISVFIQSKSFKNYVFNNFSIKSICLLIVLSVFYFKIQVGHYIIFAFSITFFISSCLSFYFFLKKEIAPDKSLLSFFNFSDLSPSFFVELINDGKKAFFSSLISSAYNMSTVFFVGLTHGVTIAGYYGLAERYVRTFSSLISNLSFVAYSKNYSKDIVFKCLIIICFVYYVFLVTIYESVEIWRFFSILTDLIDMRFIFFIIPIILVSYFIQVNILYKNSLDDLVVKLNLVVLIVFFSSMAIFIYIEKFSLVMYVWMVAEIVMLILLLITTFKFKSKKRILL